MKKYFIALAFMLTAFSFLEFKAIAQEARFFDVFGEITYGEECLQSWQMEEASAVAEKLLLIGRNNPYVCFLPARCVFMRAIIRNRYHI
ncbi:MAG: hypothetical protein BROFUL_01493 [Candidatus Brocadia fulgida]|uniref:Uncharacterized protein n=1 Tax=Candidatus Brocadia fulgida TaxID=380242 RepID=A0A0M2UVE5_9BACT|nr:MAG: hypothetical protein BROFUL_01493 [Candidatus Brocadia fulgida]